MTADANPTTGADQPIKSLREAATRIKAAMQETPPKVEPQAKPPDPPATEANSPPETEAKPKAAPVQEPEPSAEPKPQPKPEGADVEESAKVEAEPSEVELADTPQGLADQLGVPADQLMEHIKVSVKVDGVERKVNLKELATGFQLESDYRNKTKALAEQSRQADEISKQAALERQHYAQNLAPLIQTMQATLQEEANALQMLGDTDPAEYVRQKIKFDRKVALFQQAQAEQQAAVERQRTEFTNSQKRAMADSERKLQEIFPEWKNPIKGQEGTRTLREYAKTQGVNAEVADRFFEPPFFVVLDKAMKFDRIEAGKAEARKKVVNLPRVQAAGAAKPSVKPEVQGLRIAREKLRKTGNVKDAAGALKFALRAKGIL